MTARAALHPVVEGDVARICDSDLPWAQFFGKTILITGASGMLPSYLVHTLHALNDTRGAGLNVIGLVRNEEKARRMLGPVVDRPDFSLLVQDISAPLSVDGPVDIIVHGASAARPAQHGANPVGTIRANVEGTLNLLDLAIAKASEQFTLMSSAEVYGRQTDSDTLITEDSYGAVDPLTPRACYPEGKRAAETITACYRAQHDLDCTIGRFGHVYGPGMALDDGRVQADFASDVVAGRDIVLNSDGSASRTYTYVSDAISGLCHAMLLGEDLAYNIADPLGLVTIRQLAQLFTWARPDLNLRVTFKRREDERSYSPQTQLGLDSTKLRALGWEPQIDLRHGIDRMVSSYT